MARPFIHFHKLCLHRLVGFSPLIGLDSYIRHICGLISFTPLNCQVVNSMYVLMLCYVRCHHALL